MKPRCSRIFCLCLLTTLGTGLTAFGQGLIVDRRPDRPIGRTFEVTEVRVDARVEDQVAQVRVSQTFHNPGSTVIESEYLFPLPDDGAIQDLVLLVDGKEMPGRILTKEEARRIYEEIVRSKRDPALLEYMGRGLFRTSVFPIPPGADRTVTMSYTQLLKRDRDLLSFTYPLGTQKLYAMPIGILKFDLSLRSREPIKSIYSPSDDVTIRRSSDHEASVSFERTNFRPSQDLQLLFSVAEGAIGGSVVSYKPTGAEDGYFLLLASPKVERPHSTPRPKTVVFVLDRSGSMSGKKIEQARNALKFVLDNLNEDDTFNIVVYDDRVETFKPELERFQARTRAEASRFVDNIRPGGSTNIDAALKSALGLIPDDERPAYVLFLTDGLPTAGETKERAIAENARQANPHRARLFAFGVGYDVNARLLDRLSGGNGGTSEYVTPERDIEASVGRFYARMTSPALTDIRVELTGIDTNRIYPRDIPDLFEGGQLVLVGRYRKPGRTNLRISGKVGGERQSFSFPVELTATREDASRAHVEKLWAMRRIGSLIDQIDLDGPNRELTEELIELSRRHGVLTPYTSFLADETVPLHARNESLERAGRSLESLGAVSGAAGVAQRGVKQSFATADRFDATKAREFRLDPSNPGRPSGMAGMAGGLMPTTPGRQPRNEAASQIRLSERGDLPPESVRHVGEKTFYRKNDRWVDASVRPEDEAGAIVVRQFSEPYFDLARKQSPERNRYLTFEETVVVAIDGVVYRIEPEP